MRIHEALGILCVILHSDCNITQDYSSLRDKDMFKRTLTPALEKLATKLPIVALLGPRQSGKTTLATTVFNKHKYINFENINQRAFALNDPERFLEENKHEHGLILDEIQHVPSLFSFIQLQADKEEKVGYFILTGSQNFLLNQAITQTLAGRIAILNLLPLSLQELKENNLLGTSINQVIYSGSYPRLYAKQLLPQELYPFYIQTYIERDVRQITRVTDLSMFQRFLGLCVGRIGQLLNVSSLASDCGISVNTAKSWLSILEASYIIFLLQPHFKNFSKRLIKSPKLYFYDTGIACTLLGIQSEEELSQHYLRGGLVENLVIADFIKHFYNQARTPRLYFWRDSHGLEIDCIIDQGTTMIPIEIKAGITINADYFSGLEHWSALAGIPQEQGFVVYAGTENQTRSKGHVVSWRSLDRILKS